MRNIASTSWKNFSTGGTSSVSVWRCSSVMGSGKGNTCEGSNCPRNRLSVKDALWRAPRGASAAAAVALPRLRQYSS